MRHRYKRILENLPIAILRSNRRGTIVFANVVARELFGQQVVGCDVSAVYGPESKGSSLAPRTVKSFLRDSTERQLVNVAVPVRLADGSVRDMFCSFSWDAEDETVDGVIMPGVLEHHQSLARVTESITRVSESIVRSYSLDDILSVITQEARLLCDADRAYIKLYDAEKDLLSFTKLSSTFPLERLPDEPSGPNRGMTGYVFRTRQLYRTGDVHKQTDVPYHSIFQNTVSKAVVPLLYQEKREGTDSEEVCYGVLSIDGTEQNQFGKETEEILTILGRHAAIAIAQVRLFQGSLDLYEQLLREVRYVSDTVGLRTILHDGKNFIRDVILIVEEIQKSVGESAFKKKTAKEMRGQLDSLRDLHDFMGVLLEQGRDSGKQNPKKTEPANLMSLARQVIKVFSVSDVRISLQCEKPEYFAYGGSTRLLLILYNLIKNAITAIKRSGKSGSVVISISDSTVRPGFRRIQIADDGPGLPKQLLEFVRGGQAFSRHPGGSGLGLLTVRETIKGMRGSLEVYSRHGHGTKFTIDLPGPAEE